MRIEIKDRQDGRVLFAGEYESLRRAVGPMRSRLRPSGWSPMRRSRRSMTRCGRRSWTSA